MLLFAESWIAYKANLARKRPQELFAATPTLPRASRTRPRPAAIQGKIALAFIDPVDRVPFQI
jgi:hypothetical protein